MSEHNEEIRQEVADIRYFSERMLGALHEHDEHAQLKVLHDLARLVCAMYHLHVVPVFSMLVSIWNSGTAELRIRRVTDDEARQMTFRIIGEIFGKYGLPDPGYEEDEL
jgi:hypothetical protein